MLPGPVGGYVSSANYNSRGQLTSLVYPNGTSTTYSYNPSRQWLTSAQVTHSSGSVLYQSSYGYDAAARVTAMSSTTNPLSSLTLATTRSAA